MRKVDNRLKKLKELLDQQEQTNNEIRKLVKELAPFLQETIDTKTRKPVQSIQTPKYAFSGITRCITRHHYRVREKSVSNNTAGYTIASK